MIGSDQVHPEIEQIVDGGVSAQKPLAVFDRLEFSHPSFTDSRWLMRQLRSIVGILRFIIDRSRYRLSVRHVVASHLIRNDLPWLAIMASQQALDKPLFRLAIPARLKEYVEKVP